MKVLQRSREVGFVALAVSGNVGRRRPRPHTARPPLRRAPRPAAQAPAPAPAAAPGRAAAPAGIPAGHVGRGHHRVPAGQRPAGAALPRPVEADHHGERHLQGGIAARELRRDGHGAPARAPGVQGHAQAPQHPAGADRARHPAERQHLDRPHQLLRDLLRHRRQPALGARPRSRPDGELLHRQEGPRQRDDRRPQRAGKRREQPDRRAGGPRDVHRVPVAQLRQVHHRQPQRPRERADRPPAGVLQDALPARQRRAARSPGASRNSGRWIWWRSTSA